MKLSYSCMPSVKSIIEGHNRRILNNKADLEEESKCNCPKNATCPLEGECLAKRYHIPSHGNKGKRRRICRGNSYNIQVKTSKSQSIIQSGTETQFNGIISKHIWNLKDKNLNYAIKWRILSRASHYSNTTKRCNLCITEKYYILCKRGFATLNKRNELINKCRHKDKFLLRHLK